MMKHDFMLNSGDKTAGELTRNMINEFYDELEGLACCCMAAGVPADMFILSPPKLECSSFNQVSLTGYVGFKPI